MFAYWFLFGVFAVGAFRFTPVAPLPSHVPSAPARVPFRLHEQGGRLLTIATLIPVLMIGLRYDVGTDWGAYVEMFEEIRRRGLDYGLSRIDPGYGLLNWIVGMAGFEFWLVNLVCAGLFMFGLVKFARIQSHPWLAIAVAIPYLVIGVGMGYSRQAVAIGLGMAGLATIASNGSFIRFVVWVLAASLFHRTAVVLIPIVALAYSKNRFQSVVIGALGCLVGYYVLAQGQGIEHFQRGYISQTRESQGAGIRLAMNLPPAVIFLALARRFTRDPTQGRIWLIFALIAVFSFAAWIFVTSTTALDRMALYIIPLQVFVLSRIPTALSLPGRASGLLVTAVILYSAVVELVWLNFSNNARYWLPYQIYPFF